MDMDFLTLCGYIYNSELGSGHLRDAVLTLVRGFFTTFRRRLLSNHVLTDFSVLWHVAASSET